MSKLYADLDKRQKRRLHRRAVRRYERSGEIRGSILTFMYYYHKAKARVF